MDFALKAGDMVPSITATLKDSDGAPIDIQQAEVYFAMTLIDEAEPTVEAAATNLQQGDGQDGSKGMVRYDWTAGDTDIAGGYRAEWRVDFYDGPGTVPNDGYVMVGILPALGGGS